MVKRIKYAVVCVLCIALASMFFACSGKEESQKTQGVVSSTKPTGMTIVTQQPNVTATAEAPTPSPEVTEKVPVATVEPGKETYAGGIASEAATEYAFQTTGTTNEHRMLTESIAVQFFATVAFDGLALSCPTYSDEVGTLEFSLYPWKGTYQDTISADNQPVATAEFVNYKDNDRLKMTFGTLPDGEYLLYLTSPDPSEQVGVWGKVGLSGESETRLYLDDEVEGNWAANPCALPLEISYKKTPNVLAGPLSDSGL